MIAEIEPSSTLRPTLRSTLNVAEIDAAMVLKSKLRLALSWCRDGTEIDAAIDAEMYNAH